MAIKMFVNMKSVFSVYFGTLRHTAFLKYKTEKLQMPNMYFLISKWATVAMLGGTQHWANSGDCVSFKTALSVHDVKRVKGNPGRK